MLWVLGSPVPGGPRARWARSCWSNGSLQPQSIQPWTTWSARTSTVSSQNQCVTVCVKCHSSFFSCFWGDDGDFTCESYLSPSVVVLQAPTSTLRAGTTPTSSGSPKHPMSPVSQLGLHCLSWFSRTAVCSF